MPYIMIFLFIFIVSVSVKFFFKLKMEESMLLAVTGIVVVLTVFGMLKIMNVGMYVIYAFALAGLLGLLYRVIFKKEKIAFAEIATPGFIVVLLSYAMYAIMTKNNVLYIWDEANRYGTAAHYMHVTDAIENGGSLTVLSYFFNKIAGYSEHALFVSKWLFIWVCAVVPLSNLKWDRWYMAGIYAVLAFGIITLIDPETNYLMDAAVGIAAGAGVSYLAVAGKKARLGVMASLCFLTATMKDNAGLVFLAFIVMFYAIYYFVEFNKKDSNIGKKQIINTAVFAAIIALTLLIKRVTLPSWNLSTLDFIKDYYLYIGAACLLFIVFLVCWYLWRYKGLGRIIADRSEKTKTVLKILALPLTAFALFAISYKVIWQILYALDLKLQQDFIYAFNKYFGRNYFGMSLWVLALLILTAAVLAAMTIVKSDHKKSLIAQSVSIVLSIVMYGLIISVMFVTAYHRFLNDNMLGLDRFVGTIVIMVGIWLISLAFAETDYWAPQKKQYIASFLVLLLLIRIIPLPGETMFSSVNNSNMASNKYSIRPTVKEHSDIIKENTPEDSKTLIIAMEEMSPIIGGQALQLWTYYENVPREKPDFIGNTDLSYEEFIKIINGCDYVYIAFVNESFYEKYGNAFAGEPVFEKAVYKSEKGSQQPLQLIYN
jgi:hypothetical protein